MQEKQDIGGTEHVILASVLCREFYVVEDIKSRLNLLNIKPLTNGNAFNISFVKCLCTLG